jgi:aromatic amino acid aminotransferase I / 2-aminoadipate transaminase
MSASSSVSPLSFALCRDRGSSAASQPATDVIIVEDDPYTFLQFPQYDLGAPSALVAQTGEQFKNSLVPSFLKYDTQGRVIRMDTFSKTIAPGSRVGYFIANPLFTERLLRGTEVETQAPSGWSQIILSKLLWNWGIEGEFLCPKGRRSRR